MRYLFVFHENIREIFFRGGGEKNWKEKSFVVFNENWNKFSYNVVLLS